MKIFIKDNFSDFEKVFLKYMIWDYLLFLSSIFLVDFVTDKLYPLSCKYNFHTFLCGSKIHCKDVETDGISVLHGCTHGFTDDVQFKSIYDAFKEVGVHIAASTPPLLKTRH